jgi:hypothetical protein
MAISSMSEHDFALRLDRAIARSDRAKLIEARAVPNARMATEADTDRPNIPF